MRKRMLWTSLILVMVMALAFNAFAGMGRGGMGRGGGNVGHPGMQCNLTDEQLALVQPLRERFLAATADLREEIIEARTELRSETDPAKRAALQAALALLQSDFHLARAEHIEAVRLIAPDAYTGAERGNRGMRGDGMTDRGMRGDGMTGRGMRGGPGFRAGDCPFMSE